MRWGGVRKASYIFFPRRLSRKKVLSEHYLGHRSNVNELLRWIPAGLADFYPNDPLPPNETLARKGLKALIERSKWEQEKRKR